MDHSHNTPEGWDGTADVYTQASANVTLHYALQSLHAAKIQDVLSSASSNVTFLDVAGGPGVLSVPLGEQLVGLQNEGKLDGKNVSIIASDFSPKMVELLTQRLAERSHLTGIIQPRVLDGMALDLEDNSVDAAFSNFGVFLFPDRSKGFRELYRVLKPGGKAVATSWKAPDGPGVNAILGVIMQYHRKQQPAEEQPAEQPPQQQPFKMPIGDAADFEEELKQAGFRDITVEAHTSEWSFNRQLMCSFCATNPMLATMREKEFGSGEKFAAVADAAMKEHYGDADITLTTKALVAVAYK